MFTVIEISRRRIHQYLASRTFCLPCHIKGTAKQASELVKIQSVLCEDAVCLKRLIVWRSPLQRSVEQLSSHCSCYKQGINRGIIKKSNCCCLHQVVNSGTQNWANNKEE